MNERVALPNMPQPTSCDVRVESDCGMPEYHHW